MMLYTKNPKVPTKKPLQLINKFSKVTGYKANTKNMLFFYILIMNYQKAKKKNPI